MVPKSKEKEDENEGTFSGSVDVVKVAWGKVLEELGKQ